MQMMSVLKPISFDVIFCMSQIFDYYLYTVSIVLFTIIIPYSMYSNIDYNFITVSKLETLHCKCGYRLQIFPSRIVSPK